MNEHGQTDNLSQLASKMPTLMAEWGDRLRAHGLAVVEATELDRLRKIKVEAFAAGALTDDLVLPQYGSTVYFVHDGCVVEGKFALPPQVFLNSHACRFGFFVPLCSTYSTREAAEAAKKKEAEQ
jgi:hypothetical protein